MTRKRGAGVKGRSNHRQNLVNFFIIAIIAMLIVVVILVVHGYRQNHLLYQDLEKQVRSSTRHLQESYDMLLSANRQREILISQASNDITGSLRTMQGLCNVGLKDVAATRALHYISVVRERSAEVIEELNNLQNRMRA